MIVVFHEYFFQSDGTLKLFELISHKPLVYLHTLLIVDILSVNGQRVDVPSYLVKAGDVIEVREKSRSSVKFKRLTGEDAPMVNVPKWLDRNKNTLQGTVVAMPMRDDIDFPVEEHLIVELYSK